MRKINSATCLRIITNKKSFDHSSISVLSDFYSKKSGMTMIIGHMKPTVSIGSGQVVQREINLSNVFQNGVKIGRRITGGGAIFVDNGTLLLSFCGKEFTRDMAQELIKDSLEIYKLEGHIISHKKPKIMFSGRNDIMVGDHKVGGMAWNISNGSFLCQTSLLIHTQLQLLKQYLTPHQLKLKSHGIDSVDRRVGCLNDIYAVSYSRNDIEQNFINKFVEKFNISGSRIQANDNKQIQANDNTQIQANANMQIEANNNIQIEANNKIQILDMANIKDSFPDYEKVHAEFQTMHHDIRAMSNYNYHFEHKFIWGFIELFIQVEKSGNIENVIVNTDCISNICKDINKNLVGKDINNLALNSGNMQIDELLNQINDDHSKRFTNIFPINLDLFTDHIICEFLVKEGDPVKKGQRLAVVENFKTMQEILSPIDGIVKKIYLKSNNIQIFNNLNITIMTIELVD